MVQLRAVQLHPNSPTIIVQLSTYGIELAYLLNKLASTPFNKFEFDTLAKDAELESEELLDPASTTLKAQKFYASAAGGFLHNASHIAYETWHAKTGRFTPLIIGSICRSGLDYSCYCWYILKHRPIDKKIKHTYGMLGKSLSDFSWTSEGTLFGSDIHQTVVNWGNEKNIKLPNKFVATDLSKELSAMESDPYGLLSDIDHGNLNLMTLSVIDVQEDLGLNFQIDFRSLAILFEACLTIAKEYYSQIVQKPTDETKYKLDEFERFKDHISPLGDGHVFGEPKDIPDRTREYLRQMKE